MSHKVGRQKTPEPTWSSTAADFPPPELVLPTLDGLRARQLVDLEFNLIFRGFSPPTSHKAHALWSGLNRLSDKAVQGYLDFHAAATAFNERKNRTVAFMRATSRMEDCILSCWRAYAHASALKRISATSAVFSSLPTPVGVVDRARLTQLRDAIVHTDERIANTDLRPERKPIKEGESIALELLRHSCQLAGTAVKYTEMFRWTRSIDQTATAWQKALSTTSA